MITIPFATLNMFKAKFKELCYQKIIKRTFDKLLTSITDDTTKQLFIDSYTLDEDFYIIKDDVTEYNKVVLKTTTFNNIFYNWFVGFPKNSDTDIMFYLMFSNYKGNYENDNKTATVNLYILASEDNYNEGFYIAELVQKISVKPSSDDKAYSNYIFHWVKNNNEFNIENDQYLLEVNDRDFYLFKTVFNLVYYSN